MNLHQLIPGGNGCRQITVEAFEFPPCFLNQLLGHAALTICRKGRLAQLDHPCPNRARLAEFLLGLRMFLLDAYSAIFHLLQLPPGRGAVTLQSLDIFHTLLQAGNLGPQCGASLAKLMLSLSELFVSQQAREKLSALRGAHCRHHSEFLLLREVGVEKLVVGHAQQVGNLAGNGLVTVRYRSFTTVQIQLGAVQAPNNPVLVRAERELYLHTHWRAGRGAVSPQAVTTATCGNVAVQRPGQPLQ